MTDQTRPAQASLFVRPAGSRFASPRVYTVLTAIVLTLFCVLLIYPMARMLWRTFFVNGVFQADPLVRVLQAPWLITVTTNTVIVVAISTVIAVCLGVTLAWINERTDANFGIVGTVFPIIPLLIPGIAVAIGWVFLAAPNVGYLNGFLAMLPGVPKTFRFNINTWTGLVFVYSMNGIPLVYLIVSAALKNIDPSLEEASRISGCGVMRTFLKISLPAISPAVISASLLVVINGFGTFSTAVIIGTPAHVDLLTTRIVGMLTKNFPPDLIGAQVLSILMLIFVTVIWGLQVRLTRRGRFSALGGRAGGSGKLALGALRIPARLFTVTIIVVTTVLPAVALLVVALQPYWTPKINFGSMSLSHFHEVIVVNRLTLEAFRNSIVISLVGATLAMVIAIVAAIYVSLQKSAVTAAVDFVLKVPTILPHLIIAVGFVIAFGGSPFFLSGTIAILILAMMVMYISPGAIAAGAAVSQIGRDLREASHVAGAGEGRTVTRIILPLALPGFVAGWMIVFVHMMGDLSAAAILAGLKTPVIGFALLEIWEAGTFATLAAFSTLMCLMNIAVVVTVTMLVRQFRTDLA